MLRGNQAPRDACEVIEWGGTTEACEEHASVLLTAIIPPCLVREVGRERETDEECGWGMLKVSVVDPRGLDHIRNWRPTCHHCISDVTCDREMKKEQTGKQSVNVGAE